MRPQVAKAVAAAAMWSPRPRCSLVAVKRDRFYRSLIRSSQNPMRLNQFLKEEQVALEFEPVLPARPEPEEPEAQPTARQLWAEQDAILDALASLLEKSGKVANRRNLLQDLGNRERNATTSLGSGRALA